ncbi:MAG: threonine synthase [Candidatus Desulfofervidaceae bacterium]|nr:threonine synthase [Candidatus Desulfofervidaceae bacterium]
MKADNLPEQVQPYLLPKPQGNLVYRCLQCGAEYPIEEFLYTCPKCHGIFMLPDKDFDRLKEIPGSLWREIFDYRKVLNIPGLKGIFLFHEFIAPLIPVEDIVYLGEGHTPLIEANSYLQELVGCRFYYKNDGQNPSASFKDRGMACALSYVNYLIRTKGLKEVLAICASTGDTSASAALYASYLRGKVKSAVLLPEGKVTSQQLAQPLGHGAAVFEIPGVFDDCMKVVEYLADNYYVVLLNSKNPWRIRGQESYSYEIAQWFNYELKDKVVIVPIGNAGNITAIINGFLNFYKVGIIETLPKIVGVQSVHANPVYLYYLEPDPQKRVWQPVKVKPSCAQAAMIGNPVSMPRVMQLVEEYNQLAGERRVFVVEVTEQEIMDWMLIANRNGHIVCTQGGESLAGLVRALEKKVVKPDEEVILDSTAHMLKFISFQQMYFEDNFPPEYEVKAKEELKNAPRLVKPGDIPVFPNERQLNEDEFREFVEKTAKAIADALNLSKRD